MTEPVQQAAVIVDRRAPSPCSPCTHESDIATMKERDVHMTEAIKRVEKTLAELVKKLEPLPLHEERLVTAIESLTDQNKRIEVAEKNIHKVEATFDKFKTQILTLWAVVAFCAPGVGGLLLYSLKSAADYKETQMEAMRTMQENIKEHGSQLFKLQMDQSVIERRKK